MNKIDVFKLADSYINSENDNGKGYIDQLLGLMPKDRRAELREMVTRTVRSIHVNGQQDYRSASEKVTA